MEMPTTLQIDLKKLRHNAKVLTALCSEQGVDVAAVTKAFCAEAPMVSALAESPVSYLADSRLENIARYPETGKKSLLLRIANPKDADQVVSLCDVSLQSEQETIKALALAAEKQGKTHDVILMVDLGDLREGIHYRNYPLLLETVKCCLAAPRLNLLGLGTNLTCYGGIIPTQETLQRLCSSAARLRADTGAALPFLSGGNSSSLPLLMQGGMPPEISNLRLGESILLGRETAYGEPIAGLHQDVITLSAPIVELQRKPSMPEGLIGRNAFGETPSFQDRGEHHRAILAIGRQDVDQDAITCLEEGAEILGASSDHLLLDLEQTKRPFALGDEIRFSLSYGGILGCFTSPYIKRQYT